MSNPIATIAAELSSALESLSCGGDSSRFREKVQDLKNRLLKCRGCGKQLEADWVTCPYCRRDIDWNEQAEPIPPEAHPWEKPHF